MSKAVLISIHPEWCEKIVSGEKTIEVRKTRPKLQTPFKSYIYCTKPKQRLSLNGSLLCFEDDLAILNRQGMLKIGNPWGALGEDEMLINGKVIGEFVCDEVETYDDDTTHAFTHEDYSRWNDFDLNRACMHPEDFEHYANDSWLYGWHISELKIYDKPKELSEFRGMCKYMDRDCFICPYYDYSIMDCKARTIKRPPQSWCYVEELT